MRYGSPALPCRGFAIGEGFGRWFAIARRHHGASSRRSALTKPTLSARPSSSFSPASGPARQRHRHAGLARLAARRDHRQTRSPHGWVAATSRCRRDRGTDVRAVDDRIGSLLDACPDRRELVHLDLLHYNVLVTPRADAVTAVLPWKCSTWGDAIYDLAGAPSGAAA